jgi:hypothetical protein
VAWLVATVALLSGVNAAGSEEYGRLSDPTRPQVGVYVSQPVDNVASGPTLQATRISPASRRAMIDGRFYGIGDRINGTVVTDIQPYEVTLKGHTQVTRLRLLPRVAKDPKVLPGKSGDKDG